MTRANISELQNNLSFYLARVRAGETVLVLDRDIPVAKIVPPEPEEESKALEIQEPTVPVEKIRGRSPMELDQKIDVDELLRQERDEE